MRGYLPIVILAAACASPSRVPGRTLGVQDHLAEAERHEADARVLEQRASQRETLAPPPATTYVCGDQALADQTTSGGEPLGTLMPCWTGESGAVSRELAMAQHLRVDARAHRAKARELVLAERAWCAGLPPEELDHTPFDHREDLVSVAAELDGDRLRGARIRFARVPGLTAEWLRQTLACHQALAAAEGYDPTYMASCPSTIAGAETTVIDDPAGLVVVVRGADDAAALTIYARAEAMLDRDAHHQHDQHAH